jgi:molybdopterin synthase catalytic subunit
VHLTSGPIDVGAMLREARASDGGVSVFVGIVRDENDGRRTRQIHYEAYAPMAEAEIDRLLDSIGESVPQARVSIRHRLGLLEVGDASVAVVAAAPHRAEAFAACREAIDRLKTSVPIWKKEFYADGTFEWVDPTRRNPSQSPVSQ